MTVRYMQQYDLEEILSIERQVQSHPWTQQQFQESLHSYHCTVLEQYGKVVGFCILQSVLDEANLLLIAIHPEYQGQGLGYKLLESSIKMLANNPIQIFLEVRESNSHAIALYEKMGFHQIDMRKNYYPCPKQGREHAIIMVKSNAESFADLFVHHR